METFLTFLTEYKIYLLGCLGLFILGILLIFILNEDNKGYGFGSICISILLVLMVSCGGYPMVRDRVSRSKVELCGINLNMNCEAARMMMHRFSERYHPNAKYSAGTYDSVYRLTLNDSTDNTTLHINLGSSGTLQSVIYSNPNGVPIRWINTYGEVLYTHDGDLLDYIGKNPGFELTINDTTITLKTR